MRRAFSRVGQVLLRVPQGILIGLVLFYRWVLSPLKFAVFGPGAKCRFEPSCSGYALEALRRHGFFYGSWLALRRLLRCHPWGRFGPDPVPLVNRWEWSRCDHSTCRSATSATSIVVNKFHGS